MSQIRFDNFIIIYYEEMISRLVNSNESTCLKHRGMISPDAFFFPYFLKRRKDLFS